MVRNGNIFATDLTGKVHTCQTIFRMKVVFLETGETRDGDRSATGNCICLRDVGKSQILSVHAFAEHRYIDICSAGVARKTHSIQAIIAGYVIGLIAIGAAERDHLRTIRFLSYRGWGFRSALIACLKISGHLDLLTAFAAFK